MSAAAEFSRRHRLPDEARDVKLRANATECAALATRFGIPAVTALEAWLELTPETGGTVRARGHLEAQVVQECVVSLEPVPQQVAAPIDLRILPEGTQPRDDDPESPDEIESEGGYVDLGEAVAEQLALALDPFPRAEGAALPPEAGPDPEPAPQVERPNPFAALTRLKRD